MSTDKPLEEGQQMLADTLARQQAALERNQARAASALGMAGADRSARPELTLRVDLDDDLAAAFNRGLRVEALLIQVVRLLQAQRAGTDGAGA